MKRAEYMENSEANFRPYYAQYVTPQVKAMVKANIGMAAINASKDPHMNDIPLHKWDMLMVSTRLLVSSALLKENGEIFSMAVNTCITKEAARQLKEEAALANA